MKLSSAYTLISQVASPSDSEGLKKPRAILLLWYLRNGIGIDDIEAYDYVCDDDDDQGVDAMYLEMAAEGDEIDTLHIFQSKYPKSPKNVGVADIREFIGILTPFTSGPGLAQLQTNQLAPGLKALIASLELDHRLAEGNLRVVGTFVTAGQLTPEARKLIAAQNAKPGGPELRGVDALDLAPLVEAYTSPSTVRGKVCVPAPASERFVTGLANGKVAVCAVAATDLVKWPGIASRQLFQLNVRKELAQTTKVRRALNGAIKKVADHKNFLAYHNGLTAICSKIDDSNSEYLTITDLSVVNGAQSTIAFWANSSSLTAGLKVLVKFVEVPAERRLAREVAIRSNTQNPVNPRNLRATDGVQLRLAGEFKAQFSNYSYVVAPDASVAPAGTVIQNDDAAQLLCAIYTRRPWLANRRLLLFEGENYLAVFTKDITASHIVLAHTIAERIQALKRIFPIDYVKSWRLTKLVAAFMVGELFRVGTAHHDWLDTPVATLHRPQLQATIDKLVGFAAGQLIARRNELMSLPGGADDFKVDFKREDALRHLATEARKLYVTQEAVAAAQAASAPSPAPPKKSHSKKPRGH